MRSRLVSLIYKKELLDTLRDRRTLFVALVLPLLMYPALLIGMTQVISVTRSNLAEEKQRVLIDGDASVDELAELFRAAALEPIRVPDAALRADAAELSSMDPASMDSDDREMTPEEVAASDVVRARMRRAMVENGIAAALFFDEGFGEAADRGERANATLIADPTNEPSKAARAKIETVLRDYAKAKREKLRVAYPDEEQRLLFAERPFQVTRQEVASKSQKGAYSFAPMLGMLIVIMALTGAFYPAVDLVAGEKERGTMETLLVAPVTRTEIVLGKFVTVWVIAMVTALLNLAVMALTFSKLAGAMGTGTIEFAMPASAVFAVTLILIPTCALFSAVALALSSFATSYKEGQHYMTPLFLVATPLAMMGLLPNIEISYALALVPVANVVLLVKAMLLGGDAMGPAMVATLATLVYAAIGIKVAVELFKREAVLFRGGAGQSFDATSLQTSRRGLPQEKHVFLLFFTVLAIMYFLSQKVDSAGSAVLAFLLAQVAVIAPTLGFAKQWKLDFKETFRLRRFSLLECLPIVGAAACTVVVVSGLYAQFMPVQDSPGGIQQVAQHIESIPLPFLFLLIAVLPPICEELLCRGFFLSALLPRQGQWKAIFITAALFAVLHLEAYRMPGTFVGGVMLGVVGVGTGSVLATILFHMTYNGILFSSSMFPKLGYGLQHTSLLAMGLAGIGFAIAMVHFRRTARSRELVPTEGD